MDNDVVEFYALDEASSDGKQTKHLKLSPLNVANFIKVNDLKEISSPMSFARDNLPTADGLFSNEIFGITKEDRSTIFAYVNLAGETFLHPLAYKIWSRLDSNVKLCAQEADNFVLDKEAGKLKPDPNGETGIKFLQKIIKVIDFKRTESSKRGVKIDFLEKFRDKLFLKDCVVIPVGYRDINTDKGSRTSVGEINQLYGKIIRDVQALKNSNDYGLTLNGQTRWRIQETLAAIYDWLIFGRFEGKDAQASGLSRKMGLIRRAGMKKSFDWGARLVICTQNLRKESLSDIDIDLDSIGLPLAAICANFFPYMLYWIRRWFENNISDQMDMVVTNVKTKEFSRNRIQDWQMVYSDERIKKELERFMHGMSNRFIPIEAPIDTTGMRIPKGMKPYLRYKGYMVDDIKAAENLISDNKVDSLPINERPLTWCDLIYMAALDITKDKMTLITRFPIDSYWNQFPAKIKVISTIQTEPMIINGKFYKEYPKIRAEDLNTNSTNKFIDVALPNNVRLGSIGGDYDGDTVSSKTPFSIESNEELYKLISSKRHYISMGGVNEMTTSKEGKQALYDLTKILPDDISTLNKVEFATKPKYLK